MSILELIRPELRSMRPYMIEKELEIRLHANELPWAPVSHPSVKLNHYPDLEQQVTLEEKLASRYQVASNELVMTRGGDDGIDRLMRMVLREGKDSILICPPTFSMYAFYARLQNAKVLKCPLLEEEGFTLSVDKLLATWEPSCKIIILCQPNNPTGNLLDFASITCICQAVANRSLVLVDEAYIDFSDYPSASTLLSDLPNLVVLRTLSKAYGLAGLRLGALIAQAPLIQAIKNCLPPYQLPSPTMALAEQALEDPSWVLDSTNIIKEAREKLSLGLQALPCIDRVFPSQANFLLIKSSLVKQLAHCLAIHNIAVRGFNNDPQLQAMLRISIGSDNENQGLLQLLTTYSAGVCV